MFPKELIPETTIELGSFHFASADKPKKLLAVCWHDHRNVYVMCTMHNKFASMLLKKLKGTKEKEPILCPTMLCDHNNHMVVVDLSDQY